MKNLYFGIDIGGTYIKGGLVDEEGNILFNKKIKTNAGTKDLAESVLSLAELLAEDAGISVHDAKGMGIACAGLVDTNKASISYSPNLWIQNYPLKENLQKKLSFPIEAVNDAEASLIAEQKYGEGKNVICFLMLTLGTGIGGGFVFNNMPFRSIRSYAFEVGHIKIPGKKIKCNCGEYNCFETFASTSALVRETKLAMQEHPESKMWSKYDLETVSGKTVFDFLSTDETAKAVFDEFIKNLGNGIVSLVNVLCPEKIIIGGEISQQKDKLLKPLADYVNNHIHTKHVNNTIEFCSSKHNNNSGILGSVCLLKERRTIWD